MSSCEIMTNPVSGICKTTKWSVDAGETCVFPFVFNGTLYNGCTRVDNKNVAWCATAVDTKGVRVAGRWGNCEPGCPDHEATSPTREIRCEWSGAWSPSDRLGKCVCELSLPVLRSHYRFQVREYLLTLCRDELRVPSPSSRGSLPGRPLQRIRDRALWRGGQLHVSAGPLLRVGPRPGVRQRPLPPGRLHAASLAVGALLSPIT